jgi:hypothetical protein
MIGKLHNLQKPLLCYRNHDAQVSMTLEARQSSIATSIRIKMLNKLLPNSKLSCNLFNFDYDLTKDSKFSDALIEKIGTIEQLKIANYKEKIFDEVLFTNEIDERKRELFIKFLHDPRSYNIKNCLSVSRIVLDKKINISNKVLLKYFIKSIINY